ncbi:MAG: sigma-70 family RNA polymerase sigma factor, partial [Solirubrobacteraceae bacterium]
MALTLSSKATAHDEQELVAATRAGDDRAFEELYSLYRERIEGFIMSRVRDHGRAEDIAQDVFISALRRLRETDRAISFKPWIYEIAKNACIDEHRRRSRSREVPLESDSELATGRATTLSVVPTPPAAAESRQQLNDLRGAFGGLSENHHQLLVMREFEGMSYDEMGERLQMSRQMVESGLFRARRKLNEEYQELASGRRCVDVQTAIKAGQMQLASSLGLRDQRRYARHLAHCQSCRRTALLAGVDEALVKPRRVPSRIAALLPFPLPFLRWPWGRRGGGPGAGGSASPSGPSLTAEESSADGSSASGAGHHVSAGAALQKAAAVAESAGPSLTFGKIAAGAAVLAVAGAGGAVAHGVIDSGH